MTAAATRTAAFQLETVITDEEIAEVRTMIDQPLRIRQFNEEVTRDGIRHFATGAGDDNPLWCDDAHGAASPYGSVVASPCFFYSVFAPGIAPGFPGLQSFFGTGTWEWFRAARPGERIRADARMTGMYERGGRNVDRMLVQVGQTDYYSNKGDIVARNISKNLRIPRATTGQGLHYQPRAQYQYTPEELDEIERLTLGRDVRGSMALFWEDVAPDSTIPALVKGPLDLTTIIAFYAGCLPFGYAPSDTQWKNRHLARTAPELLPNNRSAGWVAEPIWPGMGHYRPDIAHAIGMPGVYDNGWMRTTWMSQLLTDWIGDHGRLTAMESKLVSPNLVGDTVWFRGTVVAKREVSASEGAIDLTIEGRNQLGMVCSTGSATVVLPRATAIMTR
jgi:acyl dehydratase